MPEVTLKINNRGYNMTCDEGQEQRLIDLSHYINDRLKGIAAAGAARNENHLLVLTALVLADEVYELNEDIKDLEQNGGTPIPSPKSGLSQDDEQIVADAIDTLARKIERVASRLDRTALQINAEENPVTRAAISA